MKNIFLSLICLATIATAGEPNQKVRALKTTEIDYPESLKQAGHQGQGLVRLTIAADGLVAQGEMAKSSGSEALDNHVLTAIKQWTFSPATDAEGNPQQTKVQIPFEFWKDSVSTLAQKTCGDFVVDADYYLARDATADVQEMRLADLTRGVLVMAAKTSEARLTLIKSFAPAYVQTLEHCRQAPDKLYFSVLTDAMKTK